MLKCISTLLETQHKDVVLHSEALSNLLDLMDSLAELPRETTQQIRKLESGLMKRVMNQVNFIFVPFQVIVSSGCRTYRGYIWLQLLLVMDSDIHFQFIFPI